MNAGLLLITHGRIGQEILDTTTAILGKCPLRTNAITVQNDCDTDLVFETASKVCSELDQGAGVLVLTDLYGSTPSNIANRLMEAHAVHVISGVNVPMLLRIMNYPDLGLEMLAEKAASGARDGVIASNRKQAS